MCILYDWFISQGFGEENSYYGPPPSYPGTAPAREQTQEGGRPQVTIPVFPASQQLLSSSLTVFSWNKHCTSDKVLSGKSLGREVRDLGSCPNIATCVHHNLGHILCLSGVHFLTGLTYLRGYDGNQQERLHREGFQNGKHRAAMGMADSLLNFRNKVFPSSWWKLAWVQMPRFYLCPSKETSSPAKGPLFLRQTPYSIRWRVKSDPESIAHAH